LNCQSSWQAIVFGKDGADAKPYQEREILNAIQMVEE
jgi:hypothetical protein